MLLSNEEIIIDDLKVLSFSKNENTLFLISYTNVINEKCINVFSMILYHKIYFSTCTICIHHIHETYVLYFIIFVMDFDICSLEN